jgi:alanine dehydrogenase
VQTGAVRGAAFDNDSYSAVGASIVVDASDVFDEADMIVKVKEPQPQEYELFRQNQILFTFLHLAPEPELTSALLKSEVAGVAYETVQEDDGSLSLLYPMSENTGRLAHLMASLLLQNLSGGPGKMMGGVAGTEPPRMVEVGGGTFGLNAAPVASALGTHVTIADVNLDRLRAHQPSIAQRDWHRAGTVPERFQPAPRANSQAWKFRHDLVRSCQHRLMLIRPTRHRPRFIVTDEQ